MSYGATRRAGLRIPTRGVRLPRGEDSWWDEVGAFSLILPAGGAFSHATAAQIHGLPLPPSNLDATPLHVTVPRGVARGSRGGVAWHASQIVGAVTTVRTLPVTDAGRTWLDLGQFLPLPYLVAAMDLIKRRGLCSDLVVPSGIRGAGLLRQALALADPSSRSPRESILRVHVQLANLPTPRLNFDVIHEGEWIGCGDLVWPEFRIYVEYDGQHHSDPRQRHQDAQTRNRLAQLGWTVRVVTSAMMGSVHNVISMLAEDLRARGWCG